MQAPVTHILPLTTIVRERRLPAPGRVLARQGQKVSAIDVVAETNLPQQHVLLDAARGLGMSPEDAEKLIQCKVGDRLTRGALVVQVRDAMARAAVRVPREGVVVAVGGGQVLLEVGETAFQLQAGLTGTVVEVLPDRGVIIQGAGALVQGIWGNGRVDTGLMMTLSEQQDDTLVPGRLDISLRGSIILAGNCRDAETLKVAAELPVRGLVLSSLAPGLLPVALQMRYPIILVEGPGTWPMNQAAYKILSTNIKREVALNAEPYDRYSGARPEVFIPLPVAQEPPPTRDQETFAPGQMVRLRRPPHAGRIGSLSALLPGLTALPSGLRAPAADVRLENGEQVIVPLANLEVVG